MREQAERAQRAKTPALGTDPSDRTIRKEPRPPPWEASAIGPKICFWSGKSVWTARSHALYLFLCRGIFSHWVLTAPRFLTAMACRIPHMRPQIPGSMRPQIHGSMGPQSYGSLRFPACYQYPPIWHMSDLWIHDTPHVIIRCNHRDPRV